MNTNNGGGYLGAGHDSRSAFPRRKLAQYRRLLPHGLWGGQRLKNTWSLAIWPVVISCGMASSASIMEPMRDSAFNMGTDNAWSICNSIVYIVLGFGRSSISISTIIFFKAKNSFFARFVGLDFASVGLFFPFIHA
jgi:hypothetical protein